MRYISCTQYAYFVAEPNRQKEEACMHDISGQLYHPSAALNIKRRTIDRVLQLNRFAELVVVRRQRLDEETVRVQRLVRVREGVDSRNRSIILPQRSETRSRTLMSREITLIWPLISSALI